MIYNNIVRFLILMLMVIFVLHTDVGADTNEPDKIVNRFISSSGLEEAVESFPDQFQEGLQQRLAMSKHTKAEKEIVKVLNELIDSFDKDIALDRLKRFIKENYRQESLESVIGWFESPVGRRITQEESNSKQPGQQGQMLRYIDDMKSNPPPDDRVKLIQRLIEVAGVSESSFKMVEELTRGMFDLSNMYNIREKISEEERDNYIEQMGSFIKDSMEEQLLDAFLYVYRNILKTDLEEYITFLRSGPGQEYANLANDTTVNICKQFFQDAEGELMELKDERMYGVDETRNPFSLPSGVSFEKTEAVGAYSEVWKEGIVASSVNGIFQSGNIVRANINGIWVKEGDWVGEEQIIEIETENVVLIGKETEKRNLPLRGV
ncbi:MAG: hypothetical protein V3U97_00925, partial [bacterium]